MGKNIFETEDTVFTENVMRTDDQYLKLNRYEEPLKIFKLLGTKINSMEQGSLLDIGCATGEFLYHLEKIQVKHALTGLELDSDLILRAKTKVKSQINQGDILNKDSFKKNSFTILTFLNTHMRFDDLKPVLSNIKCWCKPKAKVFIFGAFNPDPADVWIRYKITDGSEDRLQTGWNIPSMNTLERLIQNIAPNSKLSWEKFEIDFEIEKDPKDFLRQRTVNSEKDTFLVNGLCQAIYPYLLEIDLP